MCLGVPMQIVSIDGHIARCEAKGVQRDVSLFLLQDQPVMPGDYVLVHVGYAIQTMQPADARSVWEVLDRMLALEDEGA
jgi:hydrogenase expression/formation protein HypC